MNIKAILFSILGAGCIGGVVTGTYFALAPEKSKGPKNKTTAAPESQSTPTTRSEESTSVVSASG